VVQPGMLVPNLYRCNNLKCWSTKNKMCALYTLTPNASKICYCRFAAAPRVLSWPQWTGRGKSHPRENTDHDLTCAFQAAASLAVVIISAEWHATGRGSNHLRPQLSGKDSEAVLRLGRTRTQPESNFKLQLESPGLTQTSPGK
jgi:hypothetical protein